MMEQITGKRIMIAGTGSGCGKTTICCGLLYGLKKRGLHVEAFKCGPDFIDPMFHTRALSLESGNLDLFFSGEQTVCSLLAGRCNQADISVLEGAMGYYDGIGMTSSAGNYDIAKATKTPVILVVNARGMGNSMLALLKGFLNYKDDSMIAGIIFNRISKRTFELLKTEVEGLGISVIGYVPEQHFFSLESRYLGLVTANEVAEFEEKLEKFYEMIEHTIHWELLTALAGKAARKEFPTYHYPKSTCPVSLGVSCDEAFCFLYEDNIRYLKDRGVTIKKFSPIHDKKIPEGIQGLILCGGYPELYAKALSSNESMRHSIVEAIQGGLPCIAECGGFLYLQDEILMENQKFKWAGLFPGKCIHGNRLERFGYITMKQQSKELFGHKNLQIKAHEFHEWNCEDPGTAFHIRKASGTGKWETGITSNSFYCGFPHIYFYGNEEFAEAFLQKAFIFRKEQADESL